MNTDTMTERPDSNIYASIFGPSPEVQAAAAARDASFQDWLNSRKQAVEQQRTDDVRMARLNAIGNVLTTMVQPLGWAIGGQGKATGGVQPIDNRQYLQAFERAMKANDDLRNIGTLEGEYQFKLADENYRRAKALEDYGIKQNLELERQAAYAKQRHDYTMAEIQARGQAKLDVERYKAQFKLTMNGAKISKDLQTIFYERAATAWANYVADYAKKDAVNIEHKPMMSQDEFMKLFALGQGYQLSGSGSSGSDAVTQTATGSGSDATPSGSSKVPPSRQNSGGSGNASAGANNSKRPPSKRNK